MPYGTDRETLLANTRAKLEGLKDCIKESASLLNDSERYFYEDLEEYLSGRGYRIFTKVGVYRDLVKIRNIERNAEAKKLSQWIGKMHVDFVVTDKKGNIVRCFELDGLEHTEDNWQAWRDTVKDFVLESAGIPLTRVRQTLNKYEFDFLEALA